jgi:uncharacterized protein YccT (UPF0319 family)
MHFSRNFIRTTADGLQNTAISNNTDAITAAEAYNQRCNNSSFSRVTISQNTAISIMDAITKQKQPENNSRNSEARTTADGLQKTQLFPQYRCNNSRNFS